MSFFPYSLLQFSVNRVRSVPLLSAVVLTHTMSVWLLRDDGGEAAEKLLDRFLALPPSLGIKVMD
jgi:hypothetical protein